MTMMSEDILIQSAKTIASFCGSGVCKYDLCDECPFFVDEGPCGKCGLTSVSAPDEWNFKDVVANEDEK